MLYARTVGFQEFLGNTATVMHLRESVRAGRFPHSLILAGPRGAGKYTLALMLAKAVNCLEPLETDGLPDFCGRCANCTRIGDAANLEERVAEAVAAREELRETDKRETRVLIQTHPDVLVIPPDPPQLLIKLGQVRQAIHAAYYRPPVEARRAFTIFTCSNFMKEAANSLLKVLEEPPSHTTLILLAENPQELLPTIRSRAVIYRLGALPAADLEALLAQRRPELKPKDRALAARLAEGAVGRALSIDLGAYLTSRQDALILLRTALREPGAPTDRSSSVGWEPGAPTDRSSSVGREPDYSQLFRATETYRAGADGQEKTTNLLRALGSLLEDLLLTVAGTPALIRNVDLTAELAALAQGLNVDWIDGAARAVVQVEQGMRRNLLRSLSLDAMAVTFGQS
ncbi:MAG TPA: DNA polymerase III subunit delta' [Terracidiphilus sp.]|nr:DNA polymerase III subunit delta' [Terracidiphilus sp.]